MGTDMTEPSIGTEETDSTATELSTTEDSSMGTDSKQFTLFYNYCPCSTIFAFKFQATDDDHETDATEPTDATEHTDATEPTDSTGATDSKVLRYNYFCNTN